MTSTTGNLYEDDPYYRAWIDEISKECACCVECHQEMPCDGVKIGSFCEQRCDCDELYEDEPEELFGDEN